MNLLEKYRPTRLDEITGQDAAVRRLMRLAARPHTCCILAEGPAGTGKTSAALALANELGCLDGVWETVHVTVAADLGIDEARYMLAGDKDRGCSPLRLKAPNGWHVWLIEELEMLSKDCQRWLKDGLERRLRDLKCIVVATSNGAGKLDRALLQRFELLLFENGPEFVEHCQARLWEIWQAETDEECPPPEWPGYGFTVDDSGKLEFSMREALKAMQEALEAKAEVCA